MIKFFQSYPDVLAVMSEREDRSMRLFPDSELNLENRLSFFRKIGIENIKVIAAEIIHGKNVEAVDEKSQDAISSSDGLATKSSGIFLSITVADCVPVFFYEPEKNIVALVHCGWRSIVGGIIENAVRKISSLGGISKNLRVVLGPGINKCHFEIKEDVLDNFSKYPEFVFKNKGIFVDLKGIIKKQLREAGIDAEKIEDNRECTVESNRFFSFRRDKPEVVEAMIAIIGLKNK